jgi:hypothetical protein
MNLSTADLRNYWTEFHKTLRSYRYMFLVGPKVFSFVVKGLTMLNFYRPYFMPCFGSHFENGRHLENFEHAELLL